MKKLVSLVIALIIISCASAQQSIVKLENNSIRIEWLKSPEGWKISSLRAMVDGTWQKLASPSGEYTLIYSDQKPPDSSGQIFKTVTGTAWPDPVYKYQIGVWKESTSPVSLNIAGTATHFYPSSAKTAGNNSVEFVSETEAGTITSTWSFDPEFPTDIVVKQTLTSKKNGYYSLASPSLATVAESELSWATVPGYFQGKELQKNMILAYAYGQGIPSLPVVYRERCASTFAPIISLKNNLSFSVIPNPELGRDPWAVDKYTHSDWFLAVSHMNRKAQLSPTMYYPVLGRQHSELQANATLSFGFRFSIMNGEWYKLLNHAVNDVYKFSESLKLRKNEQSLTSRIEEMRKYLSDRETSLWNIEEYNGRTIGGQSYLGGVVGSNKDAQKNSDYGAMWMLASISNDRYLNDSVLPYALNFKLAQQQTNEGFFKGAAMGQYYLAKSKKFVEEWGEFVEPVSLTYYIMLDIGNILLFEPKNKELTERLKSGAELLLKWQKADGSWDVAYDRHTHQPLFTDLQDLRPTFYGLMVAYRILKDPKYLVAAKKGADWFLKNSVDKGHFIGVCGDARYAPDFATGQAAQALLDLYDLSKEKKYQDAAIKTARMYLTSIYTQPIPSEKKKLVNGVERQDWQISQSGLSFEHGGIIGSANGGGPILLCSHAGMFIRIYQLTGDSLFAEMARAAAIGRDAFVDKKTSVASYYWNAMNKGAGPYPHHAWWQIGWITDYLMSELQMRSGNKIIFPRGFVTPKVGPHESYGFAPGSVFGQQANLIMREKLIESSNPNIEYVTALTNDKKKLFVLLLNDIGETSVSTIKIDVTKIGAEKSSIRSIRNLVSGKNLALSNDMSVSLQGYGYDVLEIQLQ